jgi:hypothetical protein
VKSLTTEQFSPYYGIIAVIKTILKAKSINWNLYKFLKAPKPEPIEEIY